MCVSEQDRLHILHGHSDTSRLQVSSVVTTGGSLQASVAIMKDVRGSLAP